MLRYALLALLSRADRHGYDLRAAFEDLLGGTWPLNIGQVYTTLARLERDGLVTHRAEPQESVPDRKVYCITPAGRDELDEWLAASSSAQVQLKHEGMLKVILLTLVGNDSVGPMLWMQRRSYLEAMSDLTSMRDDPMASMASQLVVEAAILHLEAELKWLDLCESRLGGAP